MVKLHIKNADESQFLYETSVNTSVDDCYNCIVSIYNGRLKIQRICNELEQLKQYGPRVNPQLLDLDEDDVSKLKIEDEWIEKCTPTGGWVLNTDPTKRRHGKQPKQDMQDVLTKAIEEAKTAISKEQIEAGIFLSYNKIQDTLDMLEGVVKYVYPMNLPPYDPIRQEFENCEDLTGLQSSSEVIDISLAKLWFSNKCLMRGKILWEYIGRNEKTKVVLKISKEGNGPPPREPAMSEEDKKFLMMRAYKRQEELKEIL